MTATNKLKKATKYICLAITFLIIGYAWAAKSYLPHISRLETQLTTIQGDAIK